MGVRSETARAWLKQWRSAAAALADQRARELSTLTPARALTASDALLSLADPGSLSPDRRSTSGLVAQQAMLHRRRP
jgi:hypothetical protein